MIFLYSTSIGLRCFEPAARLVFVRLRIDLRPVRIDMQLALMRIEPARFKRYPYSVRIISHTTVK